MKKIFTIYLLLASLLLTACPSRSDLKKAYRASQQVSRYGKQATTAVGDLYVAKVISLETKNVLVDRLAYIQQKGDEFIRLLDIARAQYGNKLPDEELRALDLFFNAEMVGALSQIFAEMANLSKERAMQVFNAILILKNAIFFIADIFRQVRGESVSFNSIKELEIYGKRTSYALAD